MDPGAAMRSIHRLLRPGALAFIEYNPFYSIDGAHWSGTIDIPWAHARLDDADFERALHELHPGRPEWTCRFLRTQVNRMTQADLLALAEDAGLAVEAFLPRVRTEDVMLLDSEILGAVSACTLVQPSAICPHAWSERCSESPETGFLHLAYQLISAC